MPGIDTLTWDGIAAAAVGVLTLFVLIVNLFALYGTHRNSVRAYVQLQSAELIVPVLANQVPVIDIVVSNCGSTPAKWFEVKGRAISVGADDASPARLGVEDCKASSWPALAGNAELSARFSPDDIRAEIDKTQGQHAKIIIDGVVRYETIFGEVRESEFRYFTHIQKRGWQLGAPIKMSRATGQLRVFAKGK